LNQRKKKQKAGEKGRRRLWGNQRRIDKKKRIREGKFAKAINVIVLSGGVGRGGGEK